MSIFTHTLLWYSPNDSLAARTRIFNKSQASMLDAIDGFNSHLSSEGFA
jgi:hypothetical protein